MIGWREGLIVVFEITAIGKVANITDLILDIISAIIVAFRITFFIYLIDCLLSYSIFCLILAIACILGYLLDSDAILGIFIILTCILMSPIR